jgi:hypothetical protein
MPKFMRRFSQRTGTCMLGRELMTSPKNRIWNGNADVLGEATAVDSHHNPGVGQQGVGLLKEAHVFVPEVRQSSPTSSCR